MSLTAPEILSRLRALYNPANVEGMARYGIQSHNTLGISIPTLRQIAREAGKSHEQAADLWASGIHEARILASMVDDPKLVSEEQIERWVSEFDSWDVCDQVCSNLFDATPFAWQKAMQWSEREEEYICRAGFVLMACLAVHDKRARDEQFEAFFPVIISAATDGRNFVKKAVNWALRGIGKRNPVLNRRAIEIARQISQIDSSVARWIAADALRELTSLKIQARFK